tara:strand:+ start:344 stop:694 length:351 start_codon:yes stop_codon:yes gene_type:complete
MKNRKLYLARFSGRTSDQTFYKIGQCWQYDADERFLFEKEQYNNYDIKIMASAWGPAGEVDLWEQKLLGTKKKDFWIKEKFSGVTEIRQFTRTEIGHIISKLRQLSNEWYQLRHKS